MDIEDADSNHTCQEVEEVESSFSCWELQPEEQHQQQQRVMTSAIPNMSVPLIRKALQRVRDGWKNHTPDNPICLSDMLFNKMKIQEFCFLFTLGHHNRRHNKSMSGRKKQKQ